VRGRCSRDRSTRAHDRPPRGQALQSLVICSSASLAAVLEGATESDRRLLLPKERGHPRDLKRKVEKDRKDRERD
jgi:hypothetical protein